MRSLNFLPDYHQHFSLNTSFWEIFASVCSQIKYANVRFTTAILNFFLIPIVWCRLLWMKKKRSVLLWCRRKFVQQSILMCFLCNTTSEKTYWYSFWRLCFYHFESVSPCGFMLVIQLTLYDSLKSTELGFHDLWLVEYSFLLWLLSVYQNVSHPICTNKIYCSVADLWMSTSKWNCWTFSH